MMRLSCMSLSYQRCFERREMDVFGFLETCRALNLDAASLHIRNIGGTEVERLKKVRRSYLDQGLSVGTVGVTTDFGVSHCQERHSVSVCKSLASGNATVHSN
jgi:hypothetical protein